MKNLRLFISAILIGILALPWVAQAVSYDNNGRAMEVSLYGKGTAAGDTAVKVDSTGQVYTVTATGSSATQVQGTAASGSAPVGNPVLVAGQQGAGGTLQNLHVGPNGDLYVTIQASSSTIGAVSQGASSSLPWPFFLTDSDGTGLTALTVQASGNFPVTGTFWQATQPVSGTVTSTQGASTSLSWPVMLADGSGTQQGTSTNPLRTDPTGTTTQPVSGTFWQATQPVSGAVTANAGTGTFNVAGTATVTQGASTSLPWPVIIVGPSGASDPNDWRTPTNTTAVSVTTSAAQLLAAAPAKMVGFCFAPTDGTIYYGATGVTADNGMPLATGTEKCVPSYSAAAYFGITAAGTVNVRIQPYASGL